MSSISGVPSCSSLSPIVNEGSDIKDLSLFYIEGGILYPFCSLNQLSPDEFWTQVKDNLQNSTSWATLYLGEGEFIFRQELKAYADLDQNISPLDLPALNEKISLNELEKLEQIRDFPLHVAAYLGLVSLVETAFEQCANLNAQCPIKLDFFHGRSPLAIAFYRGHREVFEWFLEKGADLEAFFSLDLLHFTYVHQRAFAPLLIKYGYIDDYISKHPKSYSPLHEAVLWEDFKYLEFLVKIIEISVDIPTKGLLQTPLHVAVESRRTEVAQFLISLDADCNKTNHLDQSILSAAIENLESTDDLRMVELLLNSQKVSTLPGKAFYFEPLYSASQKKKALKLIRILLEYGFRMPIEGIVKLCNRFNGDDRFQQKIEILSFLFEYKSFDPNLVVDRTPLFHLILRKHDLAVARLFLERGVNPNICDAKGVSSLHLAVCLGFDDVVALLLEKGCDPNITTPTMITPLHIAASQGFTEIAVRLLGAGADVNAQDYSKSIPLHQSIRRSILYPLAEILLKAGSNPMLAPALVYLYHTEGNIPFFSMDAKNVDEITKLKVKDYELRKMCAHVFHIGGYSPNVEREKAGKKVPTKSSLEGMSYNQQLIKKIHEQIHKLSPMVIPFSRSILEKLISVCIFSEASPSLRSADFLSRIQSGEPTILNTGYWIHSVEIVFWGELLIICNRGGGNIFGHPIKIFRFDPKKLSVDLIEEIRHTKLESMVSYLNLIFILQKKLRCQSSLLEPLLQKLCPIQMQAVGNCMYANFEAAIWAMIALQAIKQAKEVPNRRSVKKIVTQANQTFELLIFNLQLNLSHSYLNMHLSDQSPYYPDIHLCQKIVDHLFNHKISEKNPCYLQREQLRQKYHLLKSRFPPLHLPEDFFKRKSQEEDALRDSMGKEPTYLTLHQEYFFSEEKEELQHAVKRCFEATTFNS